MIMATPKKIVARPEHHHKFSRDFTAQLCRTDLSIDRVDQ
jgi:hypothetical protein